MSRDTFDRCQDQLLYISKKMEDLLSSDFKYENEDGKTVDRLLGVSEKERSEIVSDTKKFISIIDVVKRKIDEFDLMIGHDSSPESYYPEMMKLNEELLSTIKN
jgi:hypothetical protein